MVSVCIATYNGEAYIKEQITSILLQLSESDEVIVSDDGSKDSTIEQVLKTNDKRIKIFTNEVRHGVIGNFENSISKASGDYIFLSDQDDVWINGKVSDSLHLLKQLEQDNPGKPALIYSDVTITDSKLNILLKSTFEKSRHKSSDFTKPHILTVANNIMGCTMAFNNLAKKVILPIDPSAIMHDWWIALAISKYGVSAPLNKPTIYYRQHGNNEVGSTLLQKRNIFSRLKTFKKDISFNIRIYRMSKKFHPINPIQFIYYKIRLHI